MTRSLLVLLVGITGFLVNVCIRTEKVYIVCGEEATMTAGEELKKYLSRIYTGNTFEISGKAMTGKKNIVFEYPNAAGLKSNEAFKITGNEQQITISGKTPRALLNGVYGLLEKMGYGFYLSLESTPSPKDKIDFFHWNFSGSPLAAERIVFNWHNFLTGCSAWDFVEWKEWIDRSSQMRFNTIMVHAYGNNPMFTFRFNGKQKRTGLLPATRGGRDYGTQQVNDVRRLYGGEVFDRPVFGSEIARLDSGQQVREVQRLMGKVFDYAETRGMKICFAFDIDTYPANPQELINTLPASARICVPLEPNEYAGRFRRSMCLANPETPEGYSFYKTQIVSLLELYPQIDQVALWMRRSGSEWLSLRTDQMPKTWQTEYRMILQQNPEYSKWEETPGRFALGKVVAAFQKALRETSREDVVLKTGSWAFDWMEPADVFFPKEVGFIGLDYNVLHGTSDIDIPEQQERIASIAQSRPVTPVFWAHHDDGAYLGRPYVPIRNLPDKLNRVGAGGFGIIHWTTWPLDPYFKNMSLQIWEGSQNQDYKMTLDKMAGDLFGQQEQEKMAAYLFEWASSAPVMGRETREWFVNDAFREEEVQEVAKGAEYRLSLLEAVDKKVLTPTGKKYFQYFKGFEKFGMGFYRTEYNYQQSLRYFAEGDVENALDAIRKCNPEQLIAQYARFSAEKGITKGEKGLLISLNLDWLPYIENQRQALGESPVRCNFAPTNHPEFGQGLLRTNFFIDREQNLWRNYGAEETGAGVYSPEPGLLLNAGDSVPEIFREVCQSGIESDSGIRFTVKPVVSDLKPFGPTKDLISEKVLPGKYRLQLLFAPPFPDGADENIQELNVYCPSGQPAVVSEQIGIVRQPGERREAVLRTYNLAVPEQGEVIIELKPVRGKANICGAKLQRTGN